MIKHENNTHTQQRRERERECSSNTRTHTHKNHGAKHTPDFTNKRYIRRITKKMETMKRERERAAIVLILKGGGDVSKILIF